MSTAAAGSWATDGGRRGRHVARPADRRALDEARRRRCGDVADWMTWHPETIEADDTTQHAGVVMIHGGFRHLPVVEGGRPVGIVSIRDLMRVVLEDVSPRGV